jgi:hypothetical protein
MSWTSHSKGATSSRAGAEESFIRPNFGIIFTGSNAPVDIYYGLTGPSSFGSGPSSIFASSGSGDIVGAASGSELYVPDGYVTDSALSDTATYLGRTFSSLGVTPGRYEWAWGSGLNQNFMLVIGTPEPSTWTMMLLGFAGLGLVGYRRTRRGAAVTG